MFSLAQSALVSVTFPHWEHEQEIKCFLCFALRNHFFLFFFISHFSIFWYIFMVVWKCIFFLIFLSFLFFRLTINHTQRISVTRATEEEFWYVLSSFIVFSRNPVRLSPPSSFLFREQCYWLFTKDYVICYWKISSSVLMFP